MNTELTTLAKTNAEFLWDSYFKASHTVHPNIIEHNVLSWKEVNQLLHCYRVSEMLQKSIFAFGPQLANVSSCHKTHYHIKRKVFQHQTLSSNSSQANGKFEIMKMKLKQCPYNKLECNCHDAIFKHKELKSSRSTPFHETESSSLLVGCKKKLHFSHGTECLRYSKHIIA